jgi:ribonuclease J
VLRFDAAGARHEAQTPAGRVLLDGPGDRGVEDEVVRDRRRLATDGVVVPVLLVGRETGQVEQSPHIVSRGFVDREGEEELLLEAEQVLLHEMEGRPREERRDLTLTRERARLALRRFFKQRTERRPMVIPVVMEV